MSCPTSQFWIIQRSNKCFASVKKLPSLCHEAETAGTKSVCTCSHYMLYLIMKIQKKLLQTLIFSASLPHGINSLSRQCSIVAFFSQRWAAVLKYCGLILSWVMGSSSPALPARWLLWSSPATMVLGTLLGWREGGWELAQLWWQLPLVGFIGCQWPKSCGSVCSNIPLSRMSIYCQPSFLLHCTGFFLLSFSPSVTWLQGFLII